MRYTNRLLLLLYYRRNAGQTAYRRLTGTAPQYLADTLSLSTNVAASCRLRSADSRTLQLLSTRRTTPGD